MFPGVYADPSQELTGEHRLRAAALWRPDAVIVGRAAAALSFWRDLPVPTLELALPSKQRPQAGVTWSRRRVPPELRVRLRGATISRPNLTVMDLVPELGGAVISQALFAGVKLVSMQRALELQPNRPHNQLRRDLLHQYRHEPWSEAELAVHVLMRQAKLTGWIANYPKVVGGQDCVLDVVFEAQRVCIEIDGFEFHGLRPETRARFEKDRHVATTLVGCGWRVIRFTWWQLTEQAEWVVTMIRSTLAWADADFRTRGRLDLHATARIRTTGGMKVR